jgi:hypothetical protein
MANRSLAVAMGNVPNPDWYLRIKNNLESLTERISDVSEMIPSSTTLSDEQLEQVRNELQAGGNQVLNVTALPGILQNTQPFSVAFGTHAQRLTTLPGKLKGGLWVETNRNQALYYSNGTAWVLIEASGYGTFETRWADLGINDTGALWIETGRNSITETPPVVYRWSGSVWVFNGGFFTRNQNQLTTLSGTLGANDAGATVDVQDYGHTLGWNGSGFNWAPGDPGSGMLVLFDVDPSGNGWHLYNGAANVSYLMGNGNTGLISLVNLTGNASNEAFLVAGTPNSGPSNNAVSGNNASVIVRRPWFRQ